MEDNSWEQCSFCCLQFVGERLNKDSCKVMLSFHVCTLFCSVVHRQREDFYLKPRIFSPRKSTFPPSTYLFHNEPSRYHIYLLTLMTKKQGKACMNMHGAAWRTYIRWELCILGSMIHSIHLPSVAMWTTSSRTHQLYLYLLISTSSLSSFKFVEAVVKTSFPPSCWQQSTTVFRSR